MKTQTSKPDITDKQLDILLHLHKFRFLNRNQIQTMLHHKYFNRVIVWLNELTEQKYTVRDFNRKFAGVPAVYYLNIKSRKILMGRDGIKKSLLNRVYRRNEISEKFKRHCMFLADIYLSLNKLTKTKKVKLNFYTQTDLYKIKYLILPLPDAYFAIEEKNKNIKRYFLDVFDHLANPKWLHKRVRQYFEYYDAGYWQNTTNKPFPEVIMICPDDDYKKTIEGFIKKRLKENISDIQFYLSTWDEIRQYGIRKEILHKVETE